MQIKISWNEEGNFKCLAMDAKLFIVLSFLTQCNRTQCVTLAPFSSVSASVSEDENFIHETFPVEPSKSAIIGIDIFLPNRIPFPVWLGIYTTEDHVNIEKQCTESVYGQVRNRDLHLEISSSKYSRLLRCYSISKYTTHCTGNVTVQDFIPRNFSFSFGFDCEEINATSSLKGLSYNVTIVTRGNETECSQLDVAHDSVCSYSEYRVFPNLIGGENTDGIPLNLMLRSSECYQHSRRFLCDLYILRCDPKSNEVIPPCREMCHDYLHGCSHISQREWKYINCDYLPSTNDAIHCLDEKVLCPDPSEMHDVRVTVSNTKQRNYSAEYSYSAEYRCATYFISQIKLRMTGNRTIYCMYNGKWSSKQPVCTKPFWFFLFVLLCVGFALIHGLAIILSCFPELDTTEKLDKDPKLSSRKRNVPLLSRKRAFDAFVLYHFDSDDSFIINNLLPELEETRDFKLCIHSRNFTAGRDITENIEEAINNSNSAIIVLSQGFVDSIWCKEEFTHCYIENMNDEAFNLFVIMMQPAETLVNISPYMEKVFETKTYLDVKDPEFFKKLTVSLNRARKTK